MNTTDETNAHTLAPIYKIAARDEWSDAASNGVYEGSHDDRRDGFIHFSTREQLRETARKHFSGKSHLVLIEINPARLGPALKWEPSRGGALFPHLYGALPVACVSWVRELPLRDDQCPDVDAALDS